MVVYACLHILRTSVCTRDKKYHGTRIKFKNYKNRGKILNKSQIYANDIFSTFSVVSVFEGGGYYFQNFRGGGGGGGGEDATTNVRRNAVIYCAEHFFLNKDPRAHLIIT